jgi:hypothetical protein
MTLIVRQLLQRASFKGHFRLVTFFGHLFRFVLTKDVTIDGPDKTVKHGTLIRLKIFGSPITSRIDEYVPESRLSWIPQGLDEVALSHLAPHSGGGWLPRNHGRDRRWAQRRDDSTVQQQARPSCP